MQHEVMEILAAQGEEQLELEVFGRGGHASMPPRHGSVRCPALGLRNYEVWCCWASLSGLYASNTFLLRALRDLLFRASGCALASIVLL